MEMISVTIIITLCSIIICVSKKLLLSGVVPTNWPVIGMLPTVVQNVGRMYDYMTEVLQHTGGTFLLKGPRFADMDMLFTCDPLNVNHVLRKRFDNYPKGPHFQKILSVFHGGLFYNDSEQWELHRRITTPLMNHARFLPLLERNVSVKIRDGLLPLLDRYAEGGAGFDLEPVFRKFALDITCMQFLDKDPKSLDIGIDNDHRHHHHPFDKAIRNALNAILYRFVLPERCWKLQRWIFGGIDREKKLVKAGEALDEFIRPIVIERVEELITNKKQCEDEDKEEFSVLTSHIKAHEGKSIEFLKGIFLNFVFGGQDTTSSALTFLFWLLAKHPRVETKILDEVIRAKQDDNDEVVVMCPQRHKLVYLNAAICETLRLFPPAPLNIRTPIETDTLPSGHVVTPKTRIVMALYSMGRMESVWGEDCMDFKPERWILPDGRIKNQPSYKFSAFSSGPRICLGKEMALNTMKMVAATIIHKYRFQPVDPRHLLRPVQMKDSLVLQMKHGFMVRINKRT